MTELLIVGGGPAGLALAYNYPGETLIVEREAEVGGLCRSIEIDGGLFDIGGHSFHTPHQGVREFVLDLMADNWNAQQRDARVWFDGELIPYPFQGHYSELSDAAVVEECAAGTAGNAASATNFEDWIVAKFGAGVARHFMLPYNRKLWARDLKRMSCEWTSERVASVAKDQPDMDGSKRKPLQSDSRIGYPMEGGFGAIFHKMAEGAGPIALGTEIVRIDPEAKVAESRDGRTWQWERLASTMPVPHLLRLLEGTPPELVKRADQLETVGLRIMMLLVHDPLPKAPQRIYVSDPAIPPHKVAFNHTSSEALRRRPVHAIMGEVSYSPDKPLPPNEQLERSMIAWLRSMDFVPEGVRIDAHHMDVPYGYPVYTHERPAIMAEIQAYLAPLGIRTLGRFGAWDYANSDECIRQGMALAREWSEA